MPKPTRDACGRFKKGPYQGRPKGPSQGQPKGPSQGHSDATASEASRAPSAASFYGETYESSDDDSLISVSDDARSLKRVRTSGGSEGSPTSGLSKAKKSTVAADTHDFGLAEAQRQLDLARRALVQKEQEERVAAKEKRANVARAKSGSGASRVLYADHSLLELERMAEEDAEAIEDVASKSSNLKETLKKALKCRAASMRGVVAELVQRGATDETRQLQAKIDRLQAEVSQLHQKLAEATALPQRAETSLAAEGPTSNPEDIIRKVMLEERAFTRACFAGIEDRLLPEKRLRPPLAADKRRSEPGPSASQADKRRSEPGPSSSQAEDALLPSTTPANEWKEVARKGKGKGKGKKSATAAPVVTAPAPTAPSQSQATGKGKRGKRKRKGKGRVRGRLVPPKTAAVVVTLTAEAAERGETYMSVLVRARANADPAKLGIGSVSCRRTQAGARIFEFPGEEGSAHADLFAAKLQEVIADSAKVARPVKSAAIEVTGLDDSVTKEEVVAAVAEIGGCSAAAVQGRDIRPGRGGMGAIRLECPVAAAKAVLDKGRLTVGLSSGAVRALEEQPLRCFRCFGIGHTRPLCPSTVDRSDTCYRCGKDGHKAATCEVTTPHCAVCAASGRPADHVMKGRNCNPPPTRGKAPSPTGSAPAASTVAPAAAAESMSE